MRTLVLDTEPVTALLDPAHPKHRRMVAQLAGVVTRRRRGASVVAAVPTAVRVEAGWNRTAPSAAAINRFRIHDLPLGPSVADMAATVNARTRKGVADSHIGAAVRALPAEEDVVVLSSDPDDMLLVSSPRPVTTVRI